MILIVLYIFILIYPYYIYFFIDFIALYYISSFHAASSMSWYLYTCLYTLMIHRHEHIYSIHLPILSMLLSLHTFYVFYAALLLYDTHIFAASRAGSGAFQYMRSIYLFLSGSLSHWCSMPIK